MFGKDFTGQPFVTLDLAFSIRKQMSHRSRLKCLSQLIVIDGVAGAPHRHANEQLFLDGISWGTKRQNNTPEAREYLKNENG